MKRYLGFALAMFVAIVAIALVGGDTGAIAGHGCHGGLLARHHAKKCHGEREGLLARHRAKKAARCHGEEVAACESGCGEAVEGCSGCGGEAVGGCAGGDCGGAGVISSEGVPTEAAPAAPAAPEAPAKT
jgi:hypothetical protein